MLQRRKHSFKPTSLIEDTHIPGGWHADTQLRKEFAERSLASQMAHAKSVAAVETELEQLQENAIEAIMLGEQL